jgi:hypothetical protein
MNKPLFLILLMMLPASVMADASVNARAGENSFLLNAPGTLTGTIKGGNDQHESSTSASSGTLPEQDSAAPSSVQGTPRFPSPQRSAPPPRQYRYVEDNERKFRQFGQTSGQNNPWFEQNRQGFARPPQSMPPQQITNPWQLGGMPPMNGLENGRAEYSAQPYSRYAPQRYNYNAQSQLYPDYPDGIFRDNNPALIGMPGPGQSGFLPGFDGNRFPFPLSPFGMF